jgi:hypothetical protein
MIRHDDAGIAGVFVKPGMLFPRTPAAGACQAGMHMSLVQKGHLASPPSSSGLSYPFLPDHTIPSAGKKARKLLRVSRANGIKWYLNQFGVPSFKSATTYRLAPRPSYLPGSKAFAYTCTFYYSDVKHMRFSSFALLSKRCSFFLVFQYSDIIAPKYRFENSTDFIIGDKHYSYFRISPDNYREEVLEALKGY